LLHLRKQVFQSQWGDSWPFGRASSEDLKTLEIRNLMDIAHAKGSTAGLQKTKFEQAALAGGRTNGCNLACGLFPESRESHQPLQGDLQLLFHFKRTRA
jgi:hypothetical protein